VERTFGVEKADPCMEKNHVERCHCPKAVQILEPQGLLLDHYVRDPSAWSLDGSRVPEYMDNVCFVSDGAVAWVKSVGV
jgi:hypothetical protein